MTHTAKVLALLSDGQWHSHREGYRMGVMLHSRVADLRRRGYVIECAKRAGGYWYRLTGKIGVGDPTASAPGRSDAGRGACTVAASPMPDSGGAAAPTGLGSDPQAPEPVAPPENQAALFAMHKAAPWA
jgi:hypothetical protein